uniref:Uncharacterized protein n=1 Tax=Opuntia streptacantha TaxID=393608 RepID=A0A7C9F0N4_OPUST
MPNGFSYHTVFGEALHQQSVSSHIWLQSFVVFDHQAQKLSNILHPVIGFSPCIGLDNPIICLCIRFHVIFPVFHVLKCCKSNFGYATISLNTQKAIEMKSCSHPPSCLHFISNS